MRVALGGLERAVRHRVGLHHHVVLINHHQRQGHAGKQRLKALGGTFCRRLAKAQHLVLRLQLKLVVAQLVDQIGHRIARGGAAGFARKGGAACIARVQLLAGILVVFVGIPVLEQKRQVRAAHGRRTVGAGRASRVNAARQSVPLQTAAWCWAESHHLRHGCRRQSQPGRSAWPCHPASCAARLPSSRESRG